MKKDKDLNYVVKLERAIKSKYGEQAIQNPARDWTPEKEKVYLEQLRDLVDKQKKYESTSELENVNGILISRKLLNKERKLNCSVCACRMKTINDEIYTIKFDCCEKCYINYVEGRVERWQKGWRPENVKKST